MTRELTWPGLHPGDLRAAAAVVEVRARTAPGMQPLARRLLDAANEQPPEDNEMCSDKAGRRSNRVEWPSNRTTPRAGALTPDVPSGPRPRSDETGEDYHPW